MLQRFEVFRHNHEDAVGMRFIQAALSLVKDQLGILPETAAGGDGQCFAGLLLPAADVDAEIL